MKNKVHLICNAHLDPVWQWRWTEGCSEAIATFRNAVEIIHEYPELIFNHNEAILYQWVQKYDVVLFNEIRDLVAQKRWFIAGGWFLQPDVNLPPYENLVRHIRYGRDYFKSEFGVEPRVAYNFDSFGHPAGLPGLLRDFGYEMYIHQRPEKEFLELPGSLYQWKGLNNSTISAYRIEIGLYHSERKNIIQRLTEVTTLSLELGRDVALFWGLGDHGGGATRTDLDRIRQFTAGEQRVEFIHSTTDRFYDSIKPLIPDLPVYEGSLQRVFTGCYTSLARIKRRAVEASAAAVQAERLATLIGFRSTSRWPLLRKEGAAPASPGSTSPNPLLMKEGAAPASLIDKGESGPLPPSFIRRGLGEVLPELGEEQGQKVADIWHDILFNDFHDILPGSCTEPAEQDALDLYGRAMENIRRLNMESVTAINQSAEPLKVHIPVTVFNSNPGLTTFPVEFECMSDYRPFWEGEWVLKIFDCHGNPIPCQEEQPEARLPFHRWRRKISFLAKDLGYGVHHFYLTPEAASNPGMTSASPGSTSPNPLLMKEGAAPESLIDKGESGPLPPSFIRRGLGEVLPELGEVLPELGEVLPELREVLRQTEVGGHQENCGPEKMEFLVLNDTADSWGTGTWTWRGVEGKFEPQSQERIIETGPVRTIHESVLTFHHSKIIVQRINYAEWPVTEYRIRIHWNEERKRLKLSIPANMKTPRLVGQIPGGYEEFPSDSQEYVHGTWLMLEETDNRKAITDNNSLYPATHRKYLFHNGLHGFDFDGREVRLSVLRSVAYCHEQGYDLNNGRAHKYMDMGIHDIRLALLEETCEIENRNAPGCYLSDPESLAEWLNAPPLVWPHLPIG